jgi:hypothetical protein
MALFRCPGCALPLTDAETLQVNCPACGAVLKPVPVPPAPAATSEDGHRFAWLSRPGTLGIGGVAVALLLLAAFFLGRWTTGSPAILAEVQTVQPLPMASPKPKAQSTPAKPSAPLAEPKGARAPVSYPPLALARAKTRGDDPADGAVAARTKPANVPAEEKEPPAPRVADERPAPNPNPLEPFGGMPGLNGNDFGGLLDMPGGPGKQLEQLFKMANARNQELEKLFNMAGMQDFDLLRAVDAFQGLPNLQGRPVRRKPLPRADEAPPAAANDIDELTLSGDSITDRHLEPLRNLGGLRVLTVARTAISDAGLAHLKGLKGLRRLFLADTAVTDRGLEYLQGMTELRELDLTNTRVTDAGVKRLQKSLPALKVTR